MAITIKELEMQVEERRQELNTAIAEYEEAVEHPELYSVALAKRAMDDAQRWYDEARDELENERRWSEWDASKAPSELLDGVYALEAKNEARANGLLKLNKLIASIEDMRLDCDGEVYDALCEISTILNR